MEQGSLQDEKVGVGAAQKLGAYQQKVSKVTLPQTALFWVQLEIGEHVGPLHGMYGSMVAELEVQRTIKRAQLTAFLCLHKKVIGPSKCMSTTKASLYNVVQH